MKELILIKDSPEEITIRKFIKTYTKDINHALGLMTKSYKYIRNVRIKIHVPKWEGNIWTSVLVDEQKIYKLDFKIK